MWYNFKEIVFILIFGKKDLIFKYEINFKSYFWFYFKEKYIVVILYVYQVVEVISKNLVRVIEVLLYDFFLIEIYVNWILVVF